MSKMIILLLALVILMIIIAIIFMMMSVNKSTLDNMKLTIGRQIFQVELADTYPEQYRGLSGRESLCENCGMLFTYEEPVVQNFIMRGMLFSLDFVFIRDGIVVEIREYVPNPKSGEDPVKIRSGVSADMVLELNAGAVSRYKIKIGDMVKMSNSGQSDELGIRPPART